MELKLDCGSFYPEAYIEYVVIRFPHIVSLCDFKIRKKIFKKKNSQSALSAALYSGSRLYCFFRAQDVHLNPTLSRDTHRKIQFHSH